MTKIPLYKTANFYRKLKDTISLFGTGGQLTLIAGDALHEWNYLLGAATLLGVLISMWFEDKNNNNVVDIFEEEQTTEVTVEVKTKADQPPPEIKVTTEKKD